MFTLYINIFTTGWGLILLCLRAEVDFRPNTQVVLLQIHSPQEEAAF